MFALQDQLRSDLPLAAARSISARRQCRRARPAFTLIELLVVVGIIAVIGGMTFLSYRAIAKDAKLATGRNAVMAVLDQGRSLALKNNRIVMVVFRPRLETPKKQYVEAVFTQWSGESHLANVTGIGNQVVDRFVPIPNVPARALPAGVKIAGPNYGGGVDTEWVTLSHLPNINPANATATEAPGITIGVMFAADGTSINMNPAMDAARAFVDYDNDSLQDLYNITIDYRTTPAPSIGAPAFNGGYFEQRLEDEEPFVAVVPFLCVFDDDHARELYDTNSWVSFATRTADYTDYLTKNADRLHFNRYTGVVMK